MTFVASLAMSGLMTFILMMMLKDLDGPFDMFGVIRRFLFHGKENFFFKLFDCPWCLSTWVAVPVAIYVMVVFNLPIALFPAYWLCSITVSGSIYVKVMY